MSPAASSSTQSDPTQSGTPDSDDIPKQDSPGSEHDGNNKSEESAQKGTSPAKDTPHPKDIAKEPRPNLSQRTQFPGYRRGIHVTTPAEIAARPLNQPQSKGTPLARPGKGRRRFEVLGWVGRRN